MKCEKGGGGGEEERSLFKWRGEIKIGEESHQCAEEETEEEEEAIRGGQPYRAELRLRPGSCCAIFLPPGAAINLATTCEAIPCLEPVCCGHFNGVHMHEGGVRRNAW